MCTEKTRALHMKRAAELKAKYEELEKAYKAEKEWIEAEMEAGGLNEMEAGGLTAKMTAYTSTRVDSKRLKTEAPDLYKLFSKTTQSTRFTIA